MTAYQSSFTGQHNDEYDSRINDIEDAIDSINTTISSINSAISSINTRVTALENKLNNFFITRSFQANSFTINASTFGSCSMTIDTINGYTPVGIVGTFGSGNGQLAIVEYKLTNSTTAAVWLKNPTTSAITVNYYGVIVLYMKS